VIEMRWVGKRLAAFPDLTDATLNVFANGFRIAPKRNRMANLPSAMLNQLNPDFGNPIRVTLSEIGYKFNCYISRLLEESVRLSARTQAH
jgi:hypothetical protein